MEEMELIAVK